MTTTDGIPRTTLGPRGPEVTSIALGTSPLGGMPQVYGYDVTKADAIDTVRAFLSSSINFIDTSNEYGQGESERRIGIALRESAVKPDLVIATKADPLPGSIDFSAHRITKSFEESAGRLGVEYIDVFYLHDPERFSFAEVTAPGGALDAAIDLRDSGPVGLIGVAGGDIDQMRRYLDTGKLDILLNHSQYNLIDRSANDLINDAVAAGVPFVNAAPFASGLLAKGSSAKARFQYREPRADEIQRVTVLERAADAHGVPLAALALQFSTRDTRISSTVVGVSSPARVAALVEHATRVIPTQLWDDLDAEML